MAEIEDFVQENDISTKKIAPSKPAVQGPAASTDSVPVDADDDLRDLAAETDEFLGEFFGFLLNIYFDQKARFFGHF